MAVGHNVSPLGHLSRSTAAAELRRFLEVTVGNFPALGAVWQALATPGKLLGSGDGFAWGMLPLLICDDLGMDVLLVLPLSTATECFIAALDVLDDLEDEDACDALWHSCGRATATNVATLLLFLYQRSLAGLIDQGHGQSSVVAVQRIYADAGNTACGGQQQDLNGSSQDEAAYLQMVTRKTGSLTEGICRAAATLATDQQNAIDRYAQVGLNLGIAMQIANDVAAIATERDRNDLIRGKHELSLLFALATAPAQHREWLETLLRRTRSEEGDASDVDRLRSVLQGTGAFHYALLVADVYWERAVVGLRPGPLRELVELARGWQSKPVLDESHAD